MSVNKMDFLLVGFVKAGTTSLDNILRQDRRIYLPHGAKETHFFDWIDRENALDLFWSLYYPRVQKNKIVGGIEPCYIRNAKQVLETFGKDVKILFMMRNPIEADFSLFKMGLKWGGSLQQIKWYKKYKADHVAEMYHKYTMFRLKNPDKEDEIRDEFRYEKWIKEYLQCYDLTQIKFVLFEDFVNSSEQTVREIERFIGLKDRTLNFDVCINEGGQISRNYFCARLNHEMSIKGKQQEYENVKKRQKISLIEEKLFKFTLIKSNAKMLKETEQLLKRYYTPTKKYVENLLNRNMSNIWFDI